MVTPTENSLKIKKLTETAKIPFRASARAAGMDLYADEEVIIPSKQQRKIPTNIALELPEGCYARMAGRSSLEINKEVHLKGGVCDADYRGPIFICLRNEGPEPFIVHKHDRVAQLILEKIIDDLEVIEVKELSETVRGYGCFGSTGTR